MDRRDVFCAGRTFLLELALFCSTHRGTYSSYIFHAPKKCKPLNQAMFSKSPYYNAVYLLWLDVVYVLTFTASFGTLFSKNYYNMCNHCLLKFDFSAFVMFV